MKRKRLSKAEFSKRIVLFMGALFLAGIVATYVLAWFHRETVLELSIVFAKCFTGIVSAYFAKSFLEKSSRNRHGVDSDGNFLNLKDKEASDEYGEV